MRIFAFLVVILALSGCASKDRVVYKDVFVPVKCPLAMPTKPQNDGSFESHKAKMIYYLKCEESLKFCLGKEDE